MATRPCKRDAPPYNEWSHEMCEDFCLMHGYEYMYRRDFRDPFRCCRMCEAEDANEKHRQEDVHEYESRDRAETHR